MPDKWPGFKLPRNRIYGEKNEKRLVGDNPPVPSGSLDKLGKSLLSQLRGSPGRFHYSKCCITRRGKKVGQALVVVLRSAAARTSSAFRADHWQVQGAAGQDVRPVQPDKQLGGTRWGAHGKDIRAEVCSHSNKKQAALQRTSEADPIVRQHMPVLGTPGHRTEQLTGFERQSYRPPVYR